MLYMHHYSCMRVSATGWAAATATGNCPAGAGCPPMLPGWLACPSSSAALLYSQGRRHMGQRCSVLLASQRCKHCRWNTWPHEPHTHGLSSPGYLASGGHASYCALQMPHTSSPASQVQAATPCHCTTLTEKFEASLGTQIAKGAAFNSSETPLTEVLIHKRAGQARFCTN